MSDDEIIQAFPPINHWAVHEDCTIHAHDEDCNVTCPFQDVMLKFARARLAQPDEVVALIQECRAALAEELAAYDIDPPLAHVKAAHDRCEAWLSTNAKGE